MNDLGALDSYLLTRMFRTGNRCLSDSSSLFFTLARGGVGGGGGGVRYGFHAVADSTAVVAANPNHNTVFGDQ